jgi:hypothetical protein
MRARAAPPDGAAEKPGQAEIHGCGQSVASAELNGMLLSAIPRWQLRFALRQNFVTCQKPK